MATAIDTVVIVRNKTRLEQVSERFGTARQAKFYMEQQETLAAAKAAPEKAVEFFKAKKAAKSAPSASAPPTSFDRVEKEHARFYDSFEEIQQQLSGQIKVKVLERPYLTSYLFGENELVVVMGQDGLVANTAKYCHTVPIVGVNPAPEMYDGVLLPFRPRQIASVVEAVLKGRYETRQATLAEARLTDGQRLLAFNDLFIGPSSHISARYSITYRGQTEPHSSSGIIVSTGAGSTGWLSSLFAMARGIQRSFTGAEPDLEAPALPWDTRSLAFVVREPFISRSSSANVVAGLIDEGEELVLESSMANSGVIFSDGIESDFLRFNTGSIAHIGIAPEAAQLVTAIR